MIHLHNISFLLLGALCTLAALSACKDKPKDENIVVEKVVEKPAPSVQSMSAESQNGAVTWIGGAKYTYSISRTSSDSLQVVENHGLVYHDNTIHLSVKRSDGSLFFEKTFSKANFAPMLPKQFMDYGVLLGMAFDKVEGNELHFVVSVGSPDENYEEFYCVTMVLDNYGKTKAAAYAEKPMEEEQSEGEMTE